MKNILTVGTNISKVIKIFLAVIALSGAVLTGIKSYNRIIIARYDKAVQEHNKAVKDSLLIIVMETAIVKIDTLSEKVDRIAAAQNKSNLKLNDLNGTVMIVKDQLGNHIIKTAKDKDEILNWWNAFEKKNVNATSMIPYVLNRSPIH